MSAQDPRATSARGVPLAKLATVTEAAPRCRFAASCVPPCLLRQGGPTIYLCLLGIGTGRESGSRNSAAETAGASLALLSLRIAEPVADISR